jgi:hypothetical protein
MLLLLVHLVVQINIKIQNIDVKIFQKSLAANLMSTTFFLIQKSNQREEMMIVAKMKELLLKKLS